MIGGATDWIVGLHGWAALAVVFLLPALVLYTLGAAAFSHAGPHTATQPSGGGGHSFTFHDAGAMSAVAQSVS